MMIIPEGYFTIICHSTQFPKALILWNCREAKRNCRYCVLGKLGQLSFCNFSASPQFKSEVPLKEITTQTPFKWMVQYHSCNHPCLYSIDLGCPDGLDSLQNDRKNLPKWMGLACTQLASDITRQLLLSKPGKLRWGSFVHWHTMWHEEQTSRTRWTRWTLQDSQYLTYYRTFWYLTALKFNGKWRQFTLSFKHKRTLSLKKPSG